MDLNKRPRGLSPGRQANAQRGRAQSIERRAQRSASLGSGRASSHMVRAASRAAAIEHDIEAAKLTKMVEALEANLGETGRGVPVTVARAALALAGYLLYDADGKIRVPTLVTSSHARAKVGAALSGLSVSTASRLAALLEETDNILLEDPSVRGAGAPSHPLSFVTAERFRAVIAAHVLECLRSETPAYASRQSVQVLIEERFGERCSKRRAGLLLPRFGFKYGALTRSPTGAPSRVRQLLREFWVIQLADALEKLYVIITYDETWSNAKATHNFGYAPAGSPWADFIAARFGGDRLAIVHAITRIGFLGASHPPAACGDTTTPCLNAEMMFPCSDKPSGPQDYHGNFTGEINQRWVEHRLAPAARAQFPHCFGANRTSRVISVGDGSPCHKLLTPTPASPGVAARFTPGSMNRDKLIDAMKSIGCPSLSFKHTLKSGEIVDVCTLMVDAEKGKNGGLGKGLRLWELKTAAADYLLDNAPDTMDTDYEALLKSHGISYCHLPPFNPKSSPSEPPWGAAKAYANLVCDGNRNLAGLVRDFRDGMYSDKLAREGVYDIRGGNYVPDATGRCAAAEKLYDHIFHSADGGLQYLIDSNPVLGGTLKNLVCTPAIRERALKYTSHNAMRAHIRRIIIAEGVAVDAAEDQLDDAEDDGDDAM